jgi:Ca2+/Na+ antiporter
MNHNAMLTELTVLSYGVGIVITVFIVIATLSDNPVKALLTALMLSYSLFFIYIYILKKINKHKEEKHDVE